MSEKLWYALRVTYNRELKVKAELDKKGIESFVPMQWRAREVKGRMVKKLEASVHNLIFVHIDRESMQELKATTDLPIRYIMNRETRRPIVVPTEQMQNFIAVAGTMDEQLIYVSAKPGDFRKGDRVKILGGVFEGATGYFLRFKGDRRVVVVVEGVVAVATAFMHPSLIQKINDDKA